MGVRPSTDPSALSVPGHVTLGKSPNRNTSTIFIDTLRALELWVFLIFSTENAPMILRNFKKYMDFKYSTIVDFKLIKIELRKALQTFCMCGLCCNHGTNVGISLFLTQQSFKTLAQYKSRQFGGQVSILGDGDVS